MLAYLKWGAVAVALVGLFAFGYRTGGNSARTALEALQAAQASNTAKAALSERASAAAELARVNAIVKGYVDAPPDPVAVSLGNRVLHYARVADCPVPKAGTDPAGTRDATPVTVGPSQVGRALDDLTVACAEDAQQLSALQAAWPR